MIQFMASKKRKFADSPFSILQREVNQDPVLRKDLIKKLEDKFNGKVITFFTSFGRRNVLITDDDAEMLESILAVEHKSGETLYLVVNSPGGNGLAAERMVNTCRAYSNNKFEVIVPHMAKSAATMICFGASAIHMSNTAELGPVDPQVAYWPEGIDQKPENQIWTSAEEYVRSYDNLMKAAAAAVHQRIEPFVQQLSRYDSRFIEQLKSAQQLAKDITVRMLCVWNDAGHIPGGYCNRKSRCSCLKKRQAHTGRMINAKEAADCGLKIKPIDLQCPVWHILWELYVRSDWSVTNRCGKLSVNKPERSSKSMKNKHFRYRKG